MSGGDPKISRDPSHRSHPLPLPPLPRREVTDPDDQEVVGKAQDRVGDDRQGDRSNDSNEPMGAEIVGSSERRRRRRKNLGRDDRSQYSSWPTIRGGWNPRRPIEGVSWIFSASTYSKVIIRVASSSFVFSSVRPLGSGPS